MEKKYICLNIFRWSFIITLAPLMIIGGLASIIYFSLDAGWDLTIKILENVFED